MNISESSSTPTQLMQGVKVWKNPKNRFMIFDLHYTADPVKRDPEYIARIKASMPIQQFNMEYEDLWEAFTGMPVWRDFSASRHLLTKKPAAIRGLPLLRGWDFGLTPAVVIAQMQGARLTVLHEFTDFNMGIEQFCEKYLPQIVQLFPNYQWIDFADPAGQQGAQTDNSSCFASMGTFGLVPIPGPVQWEPRKQAIEHFLVRRTREGECFGLWEPTCPTLAQGFKGGYHYPEKSKEVEPLKLRPVKNRYSHPHDALQYIAACVRQGGLAPTFGDIPTSNYFGGPK